MTSLPDTRSLYFLGRRVERLIFGGILLVVLCFIETYLTTANRQLAEDRSVNAITSLLNQLESKEPQLTALFQIKAESPSLRLLQLSKSTERQKSINETRRKLGLPPSPPPEPSNMLPKQQTYKEALDTIVSELEKGSIAQRAELEKYVDSIKSPKELIQTLSQQRKLIEDIPTTVWGIQTPRILQLQYAGLDYKFPFGFISSMLAIALAPLIVGWLGALYMTRQRELILIAAMDDYKLAFPYILNILPVNFHTINSQFKKNNNTKTQIFFRKINRFFVSAFRLFVLLIISLPMLLGFTYSLFQLWMVTANAIPYLFYIGIFMVLVMAIQILALVSQDLVFLHNKEFHE